MSVTRGDERRERLSPGNWRGETDGQGQDEPLSFSLLMGLGKIEDILAII